MALGWPWGGLGVALGWLWVALPGLSALSDMTPGCGNASRPVRPGCRSSRAFPAPPCHSGARADRRLALSARSAPPFGAGRMPWSWRSTPARGTKTLSDAPQRALECNRDATGAFAVAKVRHTRASSAFQNAPTDQYSTQSEQTKHARLGNRLGGKLDVIYFPVIIASIRCRECQLLNLTCKSGSNIAAIRGIIRLCRNGGEWYVLTTQRNQEYSLHKGTGRLRYKTNRSGIGRH